MRGGDVRLPLNRRLSTPFALSDPCLDSTLGSRFDGISAQRAVGGLWECEEVKDGGLLSELEPIPRWIAPLLYTSEGRGTRRGEALPTPNPETMALVVINDT